MDEAERIVATKRTERWSPEDREWLDDLPEKERDVVLLLVAHLKAVPVDEAADGTE